jgi:hypothetical protein
MNTELIKLRFTKSVLDSQVTFAEALRILWEKNLINTGEMAEQALVRKSNSLKQNSRGKKGSDFSDGSEHKYSTVRYESANCGRAQITGLKNKTGLIRIMVYEPLHQVNYYFKIHTRDLAGQVSPKVYFYKDGTPKVTGRIDKKLNLWDHECTRKEWSN